MSDHIVRIIPRDPFYMPPEQALNAAVALRNAPAGAALRREAKELCKLEA